MKSFTQALLATVCTLCLGGAAHAGATTAEEAKVTSQIVNGKTVGLISGTMRAFRNHSDPNAYATLRVRLNGTIFFSAQLNGVFVACFFPDTYDAQYVAAMAGDLAHGKFQIGINGGTCDPMSSIERGSLHPNYPD